MADWADKIRVVPPALPLQAPKIRDGILEAVQDALLRELQIECRYRSAEGKISTQRLHPLALVQRGPITYLVAAAFAYQNVNLYTLHRFQKVEITEDPVERPNDFDIDAYIASGGLQFGNGKTLRLKARIDENLANVLTETPMSADMQIKAKGDEYFLTATVADSWQLRWWLLSWGAAIEVVGPKGLREDMAGEIREMHRTYSLTVKSKS